jgi:hypothetical protein
LRVDKSTGQPTVIAARQSSPLGIAVVAENVYWVNAHGSGPEPFAQGTVRKISKASVSPSESP